MGPGHYPTRVILASTRHPVVDGTTLQAPCLCHDGIQVDQLALIDRTLWSSIFSLAVGTESVDAAVTTARLLSDRHRIKSAVDENWQRAMFVACSKTANNEL